MFYEEEPAKLSPSDVSLHCNGIQTKHLSKVILREKVVVIGADEKFSSDEKHDGEFKAIQFPIPNTNVTVDLFIYDIYDVPGQSVLYGNGIQIKNKLQNASFVMYVFDTCSKDSLQRVSKWSNIVQEIRRKHGFDDDPIMACLVGTNVDLRATTDSSISKSEAENIAKDYNMIYFECNGDKNFNTKDPFQYIALESYQHYRTALNSS